MSPASLVLSVSGVGPVAVCSLLSRFRAALHLAASRLLDRGGRTRTCYVVFAALRHTRP